MLVDLSTLFECIGEQKTGNFKRKKRESIFFALLYLSNNIETIREIMFAMYCVSSELNSMSMNLCMNSESSDILLHICLFIFAQLLLTFNLEIIFNLSFNDQFWIIISVIAMA